MFQYFGLQLGWLLILSAVALLLLLQSYFAYRVWIFSLEVPAALRLKRQGFRLLIFSFLLSNLNLFDLSTYFYSLSQVITSDFIKIQMRSQPILEVKRAVILTRKHTKLRATKYVRVSSKTEGSESAQIA